MTQELSNFEIDVYIRLAAHELLLQQLYVQFAHLTERPEETLAGQEQALVHVMSSLKPPASGMEDRYITLLRMQRDHGPEVMQDFFRKVRTNLPKR